MAMGAGAGGRAGAGAGAAAASATAGACTGLNSALLVTTTAPSAYTAPVRSPVEVYAARPEVCPACAAAAATVAAKGFTVDTLAPESSGARAPLLLELVGQSRGRALALDPRARRASTTRAMIPAHTTKPATAPREAAMTVGGPLWGLLGEVDDDTPTAFLNNHADMHTGPTRTHRQANTECEYQGSQRSDPPP